MIYLASTAVGSFSWYVVRVSGLLGIGLMGALMLSGIGQVTGLTYKFLEPIKAWAVHKAVALGLVGVILVHVLTLLVDGYMPFNLKQVLVPVTSTYTNNTPVFGLLLDTWGVALGVLAMYSVFLIVASSLGWIDTHKRIWHGLHYLSYLAMGAVLVHALVVGHEFREGSWRALLVLGTAVVLVGVVMRVLRAGSMRRRTEPANTTEPKQ